MAARRLLVSLTIIWNLAACSKKEPAAPPPPPLPTPATSAAQSAPAPSQIVITPADGSAEITVDVRGDELEVQAYGQHVLGKSKGDKRYYRRKEDGSALLEVKSGEGGFKLRTPDGKLLWKVKITDDKIKVSDNEENERPWSLKKKEQGRVKVVDANESELGEVKLNADTGKLKVKDSSGKELYTVTPARMSSAFGVLLMSGVPESQRGILLAELLAHGQ